MHRFEVLADGVVVGTTDLEFQDFGMGVANGAFHPTGHYLAIRVAVVAAAEKRNSGIHASSPSLDVRTNAGESIETVFVTIDDFDVPVDPEISVQFSNRVQFDLLFGRVESRP